MKFNGHKYRAERTTINGKTFASKLEADLFVFLLGEQEAGRIKDLRLQVPFALTNAKIKLISDFVIYDTISNIEIAVEAKGIETPVYKIKRRLWRFYGPCPLRIYKRSGRRGIKLFETIVPNKGK